jgi:hypothetical protein
MMLPRPTDDDLYLREVNALKPYFQLYKSWGYRGGLHGYHTKFESETTESRWIQSFTDPLFRNLQQLDVQSRQEGVLQGDCASQGSIAHCKQQTFEYAVNRLLVELRFS